MTGKNDGQKWIAPAALAVLSLVLAFIPFPDSSFGRWTIPAILLELLLPLLTACGC